MALYESIHFHSVFKEVFRAKNNGTDYREKIII